MSLIKAYEALLLDIQKPFLLLCPLVLASIAFVMTNGPSVSASIAVVSQIPTEDKNIFNVSACLSKHRGCTPISQPKKNYKSQQAVCQSQQALPLS